MISTPISVYAALGSAFANGVVYKGSRAVESSAGINIVAFDKTGTLTYGRPEVTSFKKLSRNINEDELFCNCR